MIDQPREFWIDDSNGYVYRNGINACKNEIHVIEYSAYEAVRNNNKELLDQRFDLMEKIARLEAALEKCKEQRDEALAKVDGPKHARDFVIGFNNAELESILEGR